MFYPKRTLLSVMVAAGLAATSGSAGAVDPKTLPDRSWIRLNGTVVSAADSSFRLDYGEGIITVEMDDWDWYKEGAAIIQGDKVTVSGRIDADLFESHSIEAASVYVEGLNTYYFASADDEEPDSVFIEAPFILQATDGSQVSVTGTVTMIDGREFTINSGGDRVTVDTLSMNYNPLDNEGFQRIGKGDRVYVTGKLDMGFFENNEIKANSIITLEDNAS